MKYPKCDGTKDDQKFEPACRKTEYKSMNYKNQQDTENTMRGNERTKPSDRKGVV